MTLFFDDKRKCSMCRHFIRIDEAYDFVMSHFGNKIYTCEKCERVKVIIESRRTH